MLRTFYIIGNLIYCNLIKWYLCQRTGQLKNHRYTFQWVTVSDIFLPESVFHYIILKTDSALACKLYGAAVLQDPAYSKRNLSWWFILLLNLQCQIKERNTLFSIFICTLVYNYIYRSIFVFYYYFPHSVPAIWLKLFHVDLIFLNV